MDELKKEIRETYKKDIAPLLDNFKNYPRAAELMRALLTKITNHPEIIDTENGPLYVGSAAGLKTELEKEAPSGVGLAKRLFEKYI